MRKFVVRVPIKEALRLPQRKGHRILVVRVPYRGAARRGHTPFRCVVNCSVQVGLSHMKVHIDGLAGVGKQDERRFAAAAVVVLDGVYERIRHVGF